MQLQEVKYQTESPQKKQIVSLIMLLLYLTFSPILTSQTIATYSLNKFDEALAHFGALDQLRNASWSFCAIDVSNRSVYREINSHLALTPASTLKPFTSGAALALLGSDFRFLTAISLGGLISDTGTLEGNLYIEGGGDPTLGSPRFESGTDLDSLFQDILMMLNARGITTIRGAVIADPSIFEEMPVITSWQYEDIGNHYGAGAAGISVFDNRVTFIFEPGTRVGDSVRIAGTRPAVPYLQMINEVTTGPRGSGDRVNVYGAPFSHHRWLRGTVPAGVRTFEVGGTLPDPPFHAAFALHNYLANNGIIITNPPTTTLQMRWMGKTDTLKRYPIATHLSPTLEEIVWWVNLRSINLYAEALVRMTGTVTGNDGSTDAGLKGITTYWHRKGVDLSGMDLKDGSGLSRKNKITTATLAQALAIYHSEPEWETFYNSFPVGGESGTISNRFRRGAARGNLRAKSGTLEHVRAFSGYATTTSGRTLAFSLIVNNYNGSRNQLMNETEILLSKMCEIDD